MLGQEMVGFESGQDRRQRLGIVIHGSHSVGAGLSFNVNAGNSESDDQQKRELKISQLHRTDQTTVLIITSVPARNRV